MSQVISAEVHFHQQEQASVFSESNIVDNNDERLAEIGLFSFYSLRMMCNLGVNDTSDQLAWLLTSVPTAISALADGTAMADFSLMAYPGHPGRYSFLATLTFYDERTRFDFKPKGFGFLARGVGYYGPMSVIALLRHLTSKRAADAHYLAAIGQAATLCGQWHTGRAIGMGNQNNLGLVAMGAAGSILNGQDNG